MPAERDDSGWDRRHADSAPGAAPAKRSDAAALAARSDGARLAREALTRAREAAAGARREAERGAAARRRAANRAANGLSGPTRVRNDSDDPVRFGSSIGDLLADRGWTAEAAVARVTSDWENTVGADIAAHCIPVSLRDGALTVEAESTAWATQLRLLNRVLLDRIAELTGPGIVTRITVHGPSGPSWKHGRLRVPGRGPRDTYG